MLILLMLLMLMLLMLMLMLRLMLLMLSMIRFSHRTADLNSQRIGCLNGRVRRFPGL